ncbi:MAG: hypothetical protein WC775_06235 [Patescibacteria group bacterium]|jgi:hypothetical protein
MEQTIKELARELAKDFRPTPEMITAAKLVMIYTAEEKYTGAAIPPPLIWGGL